MLSGNISDGVDSAQPRIHAIFFLRENFKMKNRTAINLIQSRISALRGLLEDDFKNEPDALKIPNNVEVNFALEQSIARKSK